MTRKKLTSVIILGALSLFLMVGFAAAAGPRPWINGSLLLILQEPSIKP